MRWLLMGSQMDTGLWKDQSKIKILKLSVPPPSSGEGEGLENKLIIDYAHVMKLP